VCSTICGNLRVFCGNLREITLREITLREKKIHLFMKKDETLTYKSAQAELQQIVQALQAETLPIDQLATAIARANDLIRFCRERLRAIEEEVSKLNSQ